MWQRIRPKVNETANLCKEEIREKSKFYSWWKTCVTRNNFAKIVSAKQEGLGNAGGRSIPGPHLARYVRDGEQDNRVDLHP
jgi:hypothetical protein